MRYHHRFRSTLNRAIAYLRPKPAKIPTAASEILSTINGTTIADQFNDLYYRTRREMSYRGIPVLKNPCDLWVTMELFWILRPCVVIETGTAQGGSATFYADMAKALDIDCRIVTVDINPKWSYDPNTRGITSLVGYSTDPGISREIRTTVIAERNKHDRAVILTLDSDHSEVNVLEELRLYSDLVTPGSYAIVEDTNVNGHPSYPDHGPGPWEAVHKFLAENRHFQIDRDCQRHFLTFNPGGWLKRVM
jgi:cephalosporin hydroxylase